MTTSGDEAGPEHVLSATDRQLNISVPADVHRQLKQLALDQDTTVKALVLRGIALLLANATAPQPAAPPVPMLDVIGDVVREFARKYHDRNLDTSRPGEVLMSFLIGRCEHYSENETCDGPGVQCELCGAATPIGVTRCTMEAALERAIAKHPDVPDDNECATCGEFGAHRTGCPERSV